jgi:DNA (cytosine-5)-methyltransferase 1
MGADGFHIDVPFNQALFGFGDAVCVPVIAWLARNYLNPLVEETIAALRNQRELRGVRCMGAT